MTKLISILLHTLDGLRERIEGEGGRGRGEREREGGGEDRGRGREESSGDICRSQ